MIRALAIKCGTVTDIQGMDVVSILDALAGKVDKAFRDARGLSHEGDFLAGFHCALPVHEGRCIGQRRPWQAFAEALISLCGKIVIVHLDADAGVLEAKLDDTPGEVLHRVAHRRLNEVVGIAENVVGLHPDSPESAVGILVSSPPVRVPVMGDEDALVDVE